MSSISRRGLLKSAAIFAAAAMPATMKAQGFGRLGFIYVGTYTGNGKGIYIFRQNAGSGDLIPVDVTLNVSNPSFLAVHPNGQYLYCVNENTDGTVSAFSINQVNGLLTFLNSQPSGGAAPAHLSVYRPGGSSTYYVLVANYTGSTIESIPINPDGSLGAPSDLVTHTDSLGPNTGRQDAPHPHMILADPSGRYILVNDLGQDRTYIYTLSANGKFAAGPTPFVQSQPGSGPRHFTFHPNGEWFYSLNELLSTINFYRWDASAGSLLPEQNVSMLPAGFAGTNTAGEIKLDGPGNVLYASNRGFDTIATFGVNPKNGKLSAAQNNWTSVRGETPRFFTPDPDSNFLYVANQNTNNITVFDISVHAKKPVFTGRFIGVGNPVCIVFV
ncbi:MAG TPA: lactonase family protein [Bryobacteraceae bacterium]|nr:lactonase family protein [Bryobacteraceae bacterium]